MRILGNVEEIIKMYVLDNGLASTVGLISGYFMQWPVYFEIGVAKW